MSKKPNKHYTKPESEGALKHITFRKVACGMTFAAGVLAIVIVVFSLMSSLWFPAAVFAALGFVAFYIGYSMTQELRAAANQA